MAELKVDPPEIDDYRYRGHLGSGGYSEVFTYESLRMSRPVAVKVLTEGASDEEARVIAQVATHTHIVDVYDFGTTSEGRPYLVMPLYSGPTYAQRLRLGPLRVADVLQLGVQLSGALEFAHRLGVLHRDIKPANILTTDTGRPGLADFGISSSGGEYTEQLRVSLPWVASEVLDGSPADERSDVYSLAATLYTLSAGHPPFVVTDGDNSDKAMLARTLRGTPPPLAAAEAPQSLTVLLRGAMATDPRARPDSAEAFGRALQGIEVELRLAQTPLELPSPMRTPIDRSSDDDATRTRGLRVIEADAFDEVTRGRPDASSRTLITMSPVSGGGRRRSVAAPLGDTPSPSAPAASAVDAAPEPRRKLVVTAALGAVVIVVLVVAVLVGAGGDDQPLKEPGGGDFSVTSPSLAAFVSKVGDLSLERTGTDSVRASWTPPAGDEPSGYVWVRCDDAADPTPHRTSVPNVTITGVPADAPVCVSVVAERDGAASDPVRGTLP